MASDMPVAPSKTRTPRGAYSAAVEIQLHTSNRVLYPSQAGHDRLIFREPQTLELSTARLIILVDGQEQESTVEILPHESPSRRIPIRIV
jgi:hypothetical protein